MSSEKVSDADNQQGRLETDANISVELIENLLRERLDPLRGLISYAEIAPGWNSVDVNACRSRINLLEGIANDIEELAGIRLTVGRDSERDR